MTNIGIIGSRKFDDEIFVRLTVLSVPLALPPRAPFTIVSGGAGGVDSWAIDEAINAGFNTRVIKADWNKFGKRAGIIRNTFLVDQCDFILAFWDGQSPGTRHAFGYAKSKGIKCKILRGFEWNTK